MRNKSLYSFFVLLLCLLALVGCDKHKHKLIFVDEVEATEETAGMQAHYYCPKCDIYFSDEKGTKVVSEESLVIDVLSHVHNMVFFPKVVATETSNGVKAHYECAGCHEWFLDIDGENIVSPSDLNILYVKNDETLSLSYTFEGDEANRKGYAQGTVTLNSTETLNKNDKFEFYWGVDRECLEKRYALHTETISKTNTTNVSFDIEENIYIPQEAKQIIVLRNDMFVGAFDIEESKLYDTREIVIKYAVLSDVHLNYTQAKAHLANVLEELQTQGVKYIIISGDLGTETVHYSTYAKVCEDSSFTGLIFASTGNHDQEKLDNRERFMRSAIYDGISKKFISLNDAPSYFNEGGEYSGDLNVKVYYQDLEENENTLYYYIELENNVYFFMDQMIDIGSSTPAQDNFSNKQLNLLEDVLYRYSKTTKNMFIVEHAPIEQYKVGDRFKPGYGAQLKVSNAYKRNKRFTDILKEYTEAIMLTGHTHVQYSTAINYIDKVYNEQEVLTSTPLARTFHVSSTSQTRWYEGDRIKMNGSVTTDAGSEGYIVYEYKEDIVFEANSFKEFGNKPYSRSAFSKYTYVIPTMHNEHDEPEVVSDSNEYRGTIIYNGIDTKLNRTYKEGLSFEYKITTGEKIIAKFYGANKDGSMNWDKYYGGFHLTNEGGSYPGLTITKLDDGYIRVEMNFAKIKNAPHGAPDNVRYLYLEQIKMTNEDGLSVNTVYDGYIDNICVYTPDNSGEELFRGRPFVASNDTSFRDFIATNSLSFEYKIESGEIITLALMNDWGTEGYGYFGYFEFDSEGAHNNYEGITTEKLADGYIKVTADFANVTKVGNYGGPNKVDHIYIRGMFTTAEGYIDNIVAK